MEHAMVVCVLYSGDEKIDIIDKKDLKGSLFKNIDDALGFIKRHTNVEYIITGRPQREEIYDYPEKALREAIVNAVCHRDYFNRGSHVLVEVFKNKVRICNPGGLPSALDKKDFGEVAIRRNPLIASLLSKMQYMEQVGTGIKRIKKAVKNYKRKITLDIEFDSFYFITFKKERGKNARLKLSENRQETAKKPPRNRQETAKKSNISY